MKQDKLTEKLYEDSLENILRYLQRFVGSKEAAEDLAHETYCKILSMKDPEVIRHPRAYLYKIAGRLALNYLRQIRRRRQDGEGVVQFDEYRHSNGHPGPESVSSIHEELALVSGAIAAMPEKTRRVFELHRFEGENYAAIANRLEISQKTVEYHMNKAIQHLLFQYGDLEILD